MRLAWIWLVVWLSGCGSVRSPNAIDAPTQMDARPNPTCSSAAKFGVPVSLMGLPLGAPRFSANELTVYIASTSGGTSDLYIASRASLTEPFGTPMLLVAENTAHENYDPDVSFDGLTFWFASTRVPNEGEHIYVVTRQSILAQFGSPELAAAVNAPDVTATDAQPFETADGQELWFASTRAPNMGGFDIWRSTQTGNGFSTPVPEAGLSSPSVDGRPTLSADRLTIYLASDRPGVGVKGGFDIWASHRSTVDDEFPAPTPVDELNTAGLDEVSWISSDNCRIYGQRDDIGIFVATRQP